MAEGNHPGPFSIRKGSYDIGHKAEYIFKVDHLDNSERTFYPLEYNTRCERAPTAWSVYLTYERNQESHYKFSIILRRRDSADQQVDVQMRALFTDASNGTLFGPIDVNQVSMTTHDELQATWDDILPSKFCILAHIYIWYSIERCHMGFNWECASKVNTDENGINLSKL